MSVSVIVEGLVAIMQEIDSKISALVGVMGMSCRVYSVTWHILYFFISTYRDIHNFYSVNGEICAQNIAFLFRSAIPHKLVRAVEPKYVRSAFPVYQ